MIGDAKYYLGGITPTSNNGYTDTPLQFYSYERKTKNTTKMIGCVPKLNGLSNLAPTGKMTVSSTFRHNPFFIFLLLSCSVSETRFYTYVSWGYTY